jgi:outer membrane biosynthesis protein TonB
MIVAARADDLRPPSQLGRSMLDGRMAIGGVLFTIAAHLVVPGAIAGVIALLTASGVHKTPVSIPDDKVVEARFVKLGKPFDPRKIPNRKAPRKTTAPQPGVAVSKNMDPPKPKTPEKPPPKQAQEDFLTRLGDRAQAFAEIDQKRQEEEGDPQGLEEGTDTQARAGDVYRGLLAMFFKRGWEVPSTLTDPSKLTTRVRVEITADRHVGDHNIVQSSGVPLFDQSVEDRINALRTQGTTLPEPPAEVRSQFARNWELDINFSGKQ